MIPKECKRLAEVDFPIAVVSAHAAREKSIRHGHPSTLHLWWARRPLASSRAVLLALLLPDPCDAQCPEKFKREARDILSEVRNPGKSDEDLRKGLLWFIGSFANWDLATHRVYLKVARELVRAAHPEDPPLVVDPFAGGGSIPLEALRLGCDAFASDLNPVACLILKVLLEEIPRHGSKVADELRRAGKEIKEAAQKDLVDFYPRDPDGAHPIAYLWARTVRCEAPSCGAEIPLSRSFWLCKKKNRRRALACKVERTKGEPPRLEFRIVEPDAGDQVGGTVTRAKATCLACHTVLAPERVRSQLSTQKGGADVVFDAKGERIGGARLLAVVTLRPGETGRHYRLPTDADYAAVRRAVQRAEAVKTEVLPNGLSPIPTEPLPLMSGTFNVPLYGIDTWGRMFTARQLLSLSDLCGRIRARTDDNATLLLACVLGRCADYWSSGVIWEQQGEFVAHTFGRQALPIVFDFAEAVPWTSSSGNLDGAIEWVASVVEKVGVVGSGHAELSDACESPLPHSSSAVWFTDPPYYFAVPYADLSDYFFVWLKRALPGHPLSRDPYDSDNLLTPKNRELCEMAHWDRERYPHKDKQFFETGMGSAFAQGRSVLREDGIGSVVFAHKTTEGWEALLAGMSGGGWTITGSWPIATERPGRLRSHESAALATSVHLICRPRPDDAPIGDWADVLRELPARVRAWIQRLQGEGVRGADLVFACIGPALEIFSRYRHVETAEGRKIGLAEYLEKVWEVVGRAALGQVLGRDAGGGEAAVGALEEDARLSALFLWTLQATDVKAEARALGSSPKELGAGDVEEEEEARPRSVAYSLPYDVVRRFAQPLGIHLEEWEDRIIKTDKGVVRLLSVADRATQLFGEGGAGAVAERLESDRKISPQGLLFPEMEPAAKRGRGRKKKARVDVSEEEAQVRQEATTLDRVHAAMLLQAAGRANALRALLQAEQERGPDFGRLANALSALYPRGSHERRLLEAMLVAMPR